jgi:hypothetical protein
MAGRRWKGYRRPLQPFPVSEQRTVPPVIGPCPAAERENYIDDGGHQITIRRTGA